MKIHINEADIRALANSPGIPIFKEGSRQLERWIQEHEDILSGAAMKDSGFYVVYHMRPGACQLEHRVLSYWRTGAFKPQSWKVPD